MHPRRRLWLDFLGAPSTSANPEDAAVVDSMESIRSTLLKKNSTDGDNANGSPIITSVPHQLRPALWQFLLGLLPCGQPAAECLAIMRQNRQRYTALYSKYLVDPSVRQQSQPQPQQHQPNWQLFNPLSQDEQSPWNQYFKDSELKRTIEQDVERTFPDYDFFRRPAVQRVLNDILFIYCRENEELSYRQGMHELLAPIVYVQYHSAVNNDSAADNSSTVDSSSPLNRLFHSLGDQEFAAHDSFALFDRLMQFVWPLYCVKQSMTAISGTVAGAAVMSAKSSVIIEDPFRPAGGRNKSSATAAVAVSAEEGEHSTVPIIRKCWRLQNRLLRQVDAKLWHHLNSMKIEPQVYGIRWFRLFYGREFELPDLLIIWDLIFLFITAETTAANASSNEAATAFEIIDWLGLALLLAYRGQLLEADYSGTLHLLMKHRHDQPPVERIKEALRLRECFLAGDYESAANVDAVTEQPEESDRSFLNAAQPPASIPAASSAAIAAKDFLGDLKRTIEPVLGPLGNSFQSKSISLIRETVNTLPDQVGKGLKSISPAVRQEKPKPQRQQSSSSAANTSSNVASNSVDRLRSVAGHFRAEVDAIQIALDSVKSLHRQLTEEDNVTMASAPFESMNTLSPGVSASTAAFFPVSSTNTTTASNSSINNSSPFYSDDLSAVLNPFEQRAQPPPAPFTVGALTTSAAAADKRRQMISGLVGVEDQLSGCVERMTFALSDLLLLITSSTNNNIGKLNPANAAPLPSAEIIPKEDRLKNLIESLQPPLSDANALQMPTSKPISSANTTSSLPPPPHKVPFISTSAAGEDSKQGLRKKLLQDLLS